MREPDVEEVTGKPNESNDWLDNILRQAFREDTNSHLELGQPSKEFRQRSLVAASVAYQTAKLRYERRRIGFVPMPLAEYIQGLVKVTGVQMQSVLGRFGIDELSEVTSNSARKVAQLAEDLGIGLREMLIHVRIGFVERTNSVPVPLLLAHHRSTGVRDQLSECEAVLGLAEAGYDGELLNELRRTEFEIRMAYKQGEKP
jgi:hypothetical protein